MEEAARRAGLIGQLEIYELACDLYRQIQLRGSHLRHPKHAFPFICLELAVSLIQRQNQQSGSRMKMSALCGLSDLIYRKACESVVAVLQESSSSPELAKRFILTLEELATASGLQQHFNLVQQAWNHPSVRALHQSLPGNRSSILEAAVIYTVGSTFIGRFGLDRIAELAYTSLDQLKRLAEMVRAAIQDDLITPWKADQALLTLVRTSLSRQQQQQKELHVNPEKRLRDSEQPSRASLPSIYQYGMVTMIPSRYLDPLK